MRRHRAIVALALAVVALALLVAACGGGDENGDSTTADPAAPAPPSQGEAPSVGALPPEFVECMAEQGYEIESSADVHSAPPQVLQQCFGH